LKLHKLIANASRHAGAHPRRLAFRTLLPAAAALAMLLAAGCAKPPPPGPDPKAAAETYLAALKAGDYQTCYRMLAESDLLHGSLDEFLSNVPMAPNADRLWFRRLESATRYQVGALRNRGSEAIMPVNVTTPNLVQWERMLGEQATDRDQVQAAASRQLNAGNYPRLSYPDQMVMVMEGGEWHVLAGFAQRARIERLHQQALEAYHDFDYDKALSIYRQILDRLDKAVFTASGELIRRFSMEVKTVAAARDGRSAAQAYRPRLTLKNVATRPAAPGGTGMFGQITNSGERALDQVELTISYYTNDGKPIYDERHTPIATPLEFTDFNLPIVPFGPGQTRDFGVTLKAPQEIQQEGQPRAAVSGVIFSEFGQALAPPPKLAGLHPEQSGPANTRNEPNPAVTATPAPAPSAISTPLPGNSALRANESSATPEPTAPKKHRRRRHHRAATP
jgi:hypothetical protein